MIYGLTYGFQMSEKATIDYNNRKNKFSFDENGIKFVIPIFNFTLKTNYNNIKDIEFKLNEDFEEYLIFFKNFAEVEHHENSWFMNRKFLIKQSKKNLFKK